LAEKTREVELDEGKDSYSSDLCLCAEDSVWFSYLRAG